MNRKQKGLCTLAAVCLMLLGINYIRSERVLNGLLAQEQGRLSAQRRTPQQRAMWLKQNRRLADLWLARQQRDVTPDLLPLLKSADADIQRRVVRALGRLESPKAQKPLELLLKQGRQNQGALTTTLKLALGRVKGHNLKGQAKVEAVAQSVGLSYAQVARLSQKVNAPRSQAQGTKGDEIVDEFIDLLYFMGKYGQNIHLLSRKLTLNPAQRVVLKAASLSTNQEITLILDYLSTVDVEGDDDSGLADRHLLQLGASANNQLVLRLKDVKQNPDKYVQHNGYVFLFRAASKTGDARAQAALKQIESDFEQDFQKAPNSPRGWAYFFAEQSSRTMKNNLAFLVFP